MKDAIQAQLEAGFSLMELMVSMLILIPAMSAALGFFSVGVSQQAAERNSIDVNQDARSAFEIMTSEIAQAGSHGDKNTRLAAPVNALTVAQAASVDSAAGFTVGDYVDVDTGGNYELVQVTAVSGNTISGIYRTAHAQNAPVRLFALPYATGIIPPSGMGVNASRTVTSLGFFGDITNNSTLSYVEYGYDSTNNQITRSITPITQTSENQGIPFVRNIKPGSVQFTLNTDSLGVVTSATISMTVRNTWKTGSAYQETELSSKITIPSAIAASVLMDELRRFGGVNRLPSTPSQVTSWVPQ